jgi:hypothetical protein
VNPLPRHGGESSTLRALVNGAYLVPTDRVAAFQAVLGELREEYRRFGITFELTGPWPPYNFVADAA